MNRGWIVLLLTLLGAVPGLAQACTVCGGVNEQTGFALLINTAVMSLLPLGLIGGGVYLLYAYSRPGVWSDGRS